MYNAFTYYVQGYLFFGTKGTYAVADLMQGFYSNMSIRVSDYEKGFLKGDSIYYQPWVTPILTNQRGPMRWQTIEVYTGKKKGTYPG